MNIYVNRNDQTLGPYNETQVSEMIQSGALDSVDLCSVDGSDWQPISDFVQTESGKVETSHSDLKANSGLEDPSTQKPSLSKSKIQTKKTLHSSSHQNRQIEEMRQSQTMATGTKSNTDSNSFKTSSKDTKKEYLKTIRSESLYPTLRSFFRIIFIFYLIVGILVFLAGISAFGLSNSGSYLTALPLLLSGLFVIAMAFIFKEAGALLVDIADTQIEKNSRK